MVEYINQVISLLYIIYNIYINHEGVYKLVLLHNRGFARGKDNSILVGRKYYRQHGGVSARLDNKPSW